jgi:membrane associated rhomboid family serine protease
MPPYEPVTMTFPPFAGMVRRLVTINVAVFFAALVAGLIAPDLTRSLTDHLLLRPDAVVHGEVWRLATYSFFNGLMDLLFGMLTLWFCGSILESSYGSRWFAELYFTSAIGGAAIASALSFTRLLGLEPGKVATAGAWPALFGVLIVIAVRFGDMEFMPLFPLRFTIRAKYMVMIYILIYLALLLRSGDDFSALSVLTGALCGWLYMHFAPRRGMGFGVSEQLYGARNAFYRAKRRKAAKKFEVYMGKQGRNVKFDRDGKYIDPDAERKDPNDRKWMN